MIHQSRTIFLFTGVGRLSFLWMEGTARHGTGASKSKGQQERMLLLMSITNIYLVREEGGIVVGL